MAQQQTSTAACASTANIGHADQGGNLVFYQNSSRAAWPVEETNKLKKEILKSSGQGGCVQIISTRDYAGM